MYWDTHTIFGPIFDAKITLHYGRFGVEVQSDSVSGDGTKSWVVISRGVGRYVTKDAKSPCTQKTTAPHDQSSEQQSKKDISPPDIPKPNWQQQQQWQQQEQVLALYCKKILNLRQLGEIPGEMMSSVLGGIKANGMVGRRGAKTNGADLSRSSNLFKKEWPPKIAIFQRQTERVNTVHNGTFPAFPHSNTRTHIPFTQCFFSAWPSRKTEALSMKQCLCAFIKRSSVVTSICIHRLPEWTHSRTTPTPCTRTTPSLSRREPGHSRKLQEPVSALPFKSVCGYLAEQASPTQHGLHLVEISEGDETRRFFCCVFSLMFSSIFVFFWFFSRGCSCGVNAFRHIWLLFSLRKQQQQAFDSSVPCLLWCPFKAEHLREAHG